MFKKIIRLFKRTTTVSKEENSETTPEPVFDQFKMPVVIHSGYDSVDFLNKQCLFLEDFVINDQIGPYDLEKLADLNGITLDIQGGWYPLVIELIRELDKLGWDKRVSCIKQKYATLRFYADDAYDELVDEYSRRSEYICEICGERGLNRNGPWEEVLCRQHHLENTAYIYLQENGFKTGNISCLWTDIATISWLGNPGNKTLSVSFKPGVFPAESYYNEEALTIYHSMRGFGKFMQTLPLGNISHDFSIREFVKTKIGQAEYCLVCGYEAVYYNKCECCENLSDQGLILIKSDPYSQDKETLKNLQMDWFLDEGERYESQEPFYPKNPEYHILFTPEELEERKHHENTPDFWR